MEIDVRDNDCTGHSPCIGCEREMEDKKECALKCPRLAAYRAGESWEEKEITKMEETKARDMKDKPEIKAICVICHDKDKEILNKRSQTCGVCYQAWRKGTIDHPKLGKFTASQVHIKSKIKTPVKKSVKKSSTVKNYPTRLDAVTVIDLNEYPRINKQIVFLAEKYFVTPAHVIIGLLGEALAARARRRDHEQD